MRLVSSWWKAAALGAVTGATSASAAAQGVAPGVPLDALPDGAAVPTPSQVTGIAVGADRTLADWGQITRYFTALAAASPYVRVDTLGATTLGRPFVMTTVTAPVNQRRLEEIRRGQARLADPRGLSSADEARLVGAQPAVVMISCSIHSTEIGASQMAMELAYRLATVDTLRRALDSVVVLLVPSMNPDGEQMVVDWYRRGLGTAFEGGPLPYLYHPYTGHDNNRDWYMVTQRETRLVTDVLYRRWFPEVFYDVHQQGTDGMRITLPPHVDPIDPNVDPLIVRGINHVGAEMALALESRGKTGVGDGATYDLWWHGGARSAPTRHNMVGLLTEAASARIATPITLAAADLKGHERGLPRYERRVNFPNPWPGGTWRLRDIMDYELVAAESLVRMLARERGTYVGNFVGLGRKQVALGAAGGPWAYVIAAGQRDPHATARLVEVLRLGGVEVERATAAPFAAGGRAYAAGSYVVRMAQPYRAHAKDLLEPQRFPWLEAYPGGPPQRPYDVAGWTLPYQFGIAADAVDSAFAVATAPVVGMEDSTLASRCGGRGRGASLDASLDARNLACYRVAFAELARGRRARLDGGAQRLAVKAMPRVALYKPWTANMDEGWTRWVLEQYGVPYGTLTDSAARVGDLRSRYDVILVPDMTLREAREGMSAKLVPPPYAGGLGDAGLTALRAFAEAGGTLVLVDRATELASGAFGVPVRRVTPRASAEGAEAAADSAGGESLYAPGSILRVLVDRTQPLAAGMADTAAVYFTNSTTLDVSGVPGARAVLRYPAQEDSILMSGFLTGGARIAGRAALAEVPLGRGRVVLFGFRPLYRGQSIGTFRLLFNAILAAAPGNQGP